uniref:Uncharacterized protein n=1 Tax=uncultured marine virus TaxID=186617 RepID=A0A0F7L851_9VIRU|nr:hypothetical protein [uncultured marine virus]
MRASYRGFWVFRHNSPSERRSQGSAWAGRALRRQHERSQFIRYLQRQELRCNPAVWSRGR